MAEVGPQRAGVVAGVRASNPHSLQKFLNRVGDFVDFSKGIDLKEKLGNWGAGHANNGD